MGAIIKIGQIKKVYLTNFNKIDISVLKYSRLQIRLFFIVIFLLLIVNTAFSQTHINSISGRIINKATKEPIQNANVFLAYTMIGSSTNQKGKYTIGGVPRGKYWLVISHINYKTLNIKIDIKNNKDLKFNFELEPKIFQFRPIKVSAEGKTEWENNLEIFEEVFLGTSDFAEDTFIENAVELEFKEIDETLYAESQKPLIIINRAFGYRIDYSLIYFEYMNDDYVKYSGFPKFSLLQTSDPDSSKLWEINRMQAYFGSLRHFLHTICKNYIVTGQSLSKPKIEINYSDQNNLGYKLEYSNENFLVKNGFDVLYKSYLGKKYGMNPRVFLVNTNNYLTPAKNENEMYFKFEDYLEVKYQNPDDDKLPIDDDIRISWIRLEKDSVLIDNFGRYYETFQIKSYGYWANQRLADTLPYEYVIPDSMFIY